jgi:hypothetical protein
MLRRNFREQACSEAKPIVRIRTARETFFTTEARRKGLAFMSGTREFLKVAGCFFGGQITGLRGYTFEKSSVTPCLRGEKCL